MHEEMQWPRLPSQPSDGFYCVFEDCCRHSFIEGQFPLRQGLFLAATFQPHMTPQPGTMWIPCVLINCPTNPCSGRAARISRPRYKRTCPTHPKTRPIALRPDSFVSAPIQPDNNYTQPPISALHHPTIRTVLDWFPSHPITSLPSSALYDTYDSNCFGIRFLMPLNCLHLTWHFPSNPLHPNSGSSF